MASVDASGITADGILTFSQRLNVPDPIECLIKIRELISTIRNLEDKFKTDNQNKPQEKIDGKSW